ncbi:PREDICTED: uncharacterized protein LOC107121181 [Gekko japonicus]|uniref:Uncharacterized protein LOC107121181 n=1 Tax=Gekko japonicus TaxID=146911 RepID=A0ABM1L0Q4_GEKJA|nr:PREDICTED: uncharacterized protein LOC107121181 [Gekko japonicus]
MPKAALASQSPCFFTASFLAEEEDLLCSGTSQPAPPCTATRQAQAPPASNRSPQNAHGLPSKQRQRREPTHTSPALTGEERAARAHLAAIARDAASGTASRWERRFCNPRGPRSDCISALRDPANLPRRQILPDYLCEAEHSLAECGWRPTDLETASDHSSGSSKRERAAALYATFLDRVLHGLRWSALMRNAVAAEHCLEFGARHGYSGMPRPNRQLAGALKRRAERDMERRVRSRWTLLADADVPQRWRWHRWRLLNPPDLTIARAKEAQLFHTETARRFWSSLEWYLNLPDLRQRATHALRRALDVYVSAASNACTNSRAITTADEDRDVFTAVIIRERQLWRRRRDQNRYQHRPTSIRADVWRAARWWIAYHQQRRPRGRDTERSRRATSVIRQSCSSATIHRLQDWVGDTLPGVAVKDGNNGDDGDEASALVQAARRGEAAAAAMAEARLAAKRAARAEAREIRMKELERQQKEIYQVQKKYCGLDAKFGDIEQWMEDTERYNRKSRRYTSVSDEDERVSVGSRGSLRPSEYSYYLGSGSRASSRASSARASPVVEDRPDKDFDKGVRTVSSLSAATLASLGGTSSRRGSGDTSISVETEASIREIKDISELKDQIQDVEGKYMQGLKEMKDSLAEVEEKYKKAMVSNAQLDNEKTNFMYQVDALKDALLELEEQLAESRRQYEEKNKDFEREKHAHSILQFQLMEVKDVLKQREELLAEIQQLQQKQEGYTREMSDLQETIEWKEKKIGALERQKEFFDSIRSERDDLREEVNMLKEQLKKHGLIPNTEIATNGETCDRLPGSSTLLPVTSHAVKVAEDGTLGRAIEMEMKNESVENVRKREILQSTENEEHTEENEEMEIVQECLDTKTHADGSGKAEGIAGGRVASAPSLNGGLEEPAENHSAHVPRIVCDFRNSDVAELRDEWGLLGNITEVKEANTENIKDGTVVNKIDKQNNIADPCIEASLETNIVSEILSEEQNRKNQKDILVDEAGTSDNEVFEGTLDSVTQNPTETSSQSEPLKSTGDALTEAARIESNVEYPCEARKTRENKVVERDLESQAAEGEESLEITKKPEWGKKGIDKTKDRNEAENAFLQQETKVITSAVEGGDVPCACERAQAELIEEEKQLKIQEPQSMLLQHDLLVEEEQKEQETKESENNTGKSHIEKTEERDALLGTMDADAEKNNEQPAMKEILSGKNVADSASPSECQIHEERILENDSIKYRERKPEFIPDGKTLACISAAHKEFAEGQTNPTQVKTEPTGEQSTEEQVDIVQEPAVMTITGDTEKAAEGEKEDENPREAGEMHHPTQVKSEPTGEQSTEEQVDIVQEPAVMTIMGDTEKAAEGEKEDENPREAGEMHHPTQVKSEPTGEQSTEEQVDIVQGPAVMTITGNAEKAAEGEKEDENPREAGDMHHPTQVKSEPTGEQSTEEQVDIVQEPAVMTITGDTEKAAEGEKEDENPREAGEMHHPTQVKSEPTGEQSTEEQVDIVQGPAVMTITGNAEKAAEGEKEDENPREAGEMHDIVPDIQESQKVDFSTEEEKLEIEDEEAGEEYHEAIDFVEFPSGELNTSERNVGQGNEEENNKQKEEKGGATEGAMQTVLREDCDNQCKNEEQVAEDNNKEQTNQSSVKEEIKERLLTEGDENIQEEKQKESEKAEHLQIDPSVSAKAPDEVLCNTNGKLLDENNTKETAECTSEQLENLGRVVDESQEEIQVSKKGKGKSREDCVVA